MKADKEKIARLLKTARGQIDGLLKMVEDDRYCIDISNQLSATQAILQKVNNEIIQSHLKSCVKDSFERGSEEDKDEKIEEIVKLLDKLSK
ncbi:DNA-binding transcriptional regulator, FrmR family [Anaerocolumna jejuensis DSM 15929]|jgi:DNA-binding FrmR family transcriptional regulator|uniref:Copper-sensing transcriptional repressor CsoR n=1 Tax=Anaerocolumna jejuensis DSM 15929 TaxID=1121322 RepID=A0A1M6MRI8_9FIRM|nr:metal-sensing transcriptional repressor [Anaerocolumna jejuensis]SHJ86032.1 DNA-binding transcriptional regulator, FrmR family [Anaerocolumna jejuensis DSM 15929]